MTIVINNVEHVRSNLLDFSKGGYYRFSLVIRKKDFNDENVFRKFIGSSKDGSREVVVRQWLIDSVDRFDQTIDSMLFFANVCGGRLYLNTDNKNQYKTYAHIRDQTLQILDQYAYGGEVSIRRINRLAHSASSVSETSGKIKRWMFDVDTMERAVLNDLINQLGQSYITTLQSKNGYHVIAKKDFNANALSLPDNVELKDNAMVLVAIATNDHLKEFHTI